MLENEDDKKPRSLTLEEWCRLTCYPYSALAEKVPCSQPYIGMIASGKAHPSYRMAMRLEKLTNGLVSHKNWYPDSDEDTVGTPNESDI